MPVTTCVKEGQKGFKWGEGGTCFVGANARNKAAAVGRAIKAQEADRSEKNDSIKNKR